MSLHDDTPALPLLSQLVAPLMAPAKEEPSYIVELYRGIARYEVRNETEVWQVNDDGTDRKVPGRYNFVTAARFVSMKNTRMTEARKAVEA